MLLLTYVYVRQTFSWTYCIPFVKELQQNYRSEEEEMVEKINHCSEVN